MNLSRRKLLLGAAAVAVAPALPPVAEAAAAWTPNPVAYPAQINGEIFYGGAAGGGKMNAQLFAEAWDWAQKVEHIVGERTGMTGQFRLRFKDALYEEYISGPHPWQE